MRLLLSRTPVLEAWLARFDAWWDGLSTRERRLLALLAVLVFAIILVFGVIRPLQAARAQAIADIRSFETFNARLRAAGTLAPARPVRTGAPVEIVNAAAAAQGLAVRPEAIPGGVRATIAVGSYDAVLAWIADAGGALRVTRVALRPAGQPGMIAGSVDFAP